MMATQVATRNRTVSRVPSPLFPFWATRPLFKVRLLTPLHEPDSVFPPPGFQSIMSRKSHLEVTMTSDPKQHSRVITDGPERAGARAMLKAIGFTDDDLARPIIGVANTWTETMPCNYHLRRLAARVKEGIRAAGGTPMEFNTIAISDGVTMGTASVPAVDPRKDEVARRCGELVMDLLRRGV